MSDPHDELARPQTASLEPPHRVDRVLHEPLRLALAVALARADAMTFGELKAHLGTTDGNLGLHARRLEEVGYVAGRKLAAGRSTRTEYRLTPAGRRALDRYLGALQAMIDATRPLLVRRGE